AARPRRPWRRDGWVGLPNTRRPRDRGTPAGGCRGSNPGIGDWRSGRRGEVRIEFGLQGLAAARAAERHLARRDAFDSPPADGLAFDDPQRLVAIDGEDRDAAAGLG